MRFTSPSAFEFPRTRRVATPGTTIVASRVSRAGAKGATNVSSVSRDATVARSTVERYFDVLDDTLIGFRLPGWQPHLKVRERNAPKFHLFDPGVARAVAGRVREPLSDLEVGKLLETLILHDLRAACSYQNQGGDLWYWRSTEGVEVDFVWTRGDTGVAIEVKSAERWEPRDTRGLRELTASGRVHAGYGVYRGNRALREGDV